MTLKPGRVYIGDNGRTFCVNHAGYTARTTGRDISGQRVMDATDHGLKCEECKDAKKKEAKS